MSSFSWLDFSEKDRQKALEVIDLFRERDTVDELGIGTIRDAISNILLPATSVIHTRARYFFFVPWMYIAMEKKRVPAEKFAREARKREIALIEALLASEDSEGTIGRRARSTLKILPSAIYWQALRQLGIRLVNGPRERYHKSIDRYYASAGRLLQSDDGGVSDRIRAANWHPRLPAPPEDFQDNAVMSLRREEAEYLRDRIIFRAPDSLYRYLVEKADPSMDAAFPWEFHDFERLPTTLKTTLDHARNFSETIRGAPLLYNLMLAELMEDEEGVENYQMSIKEWYGETRNRASALDQWNHIEFWMLVSSQGVRVSPSTRAFVEGWWNFIENNGWKTITSDKVGRTLVHDREAQLKKGQARLDSQRARELWNGESGTAQLSYRWRIAQQVVSDIAEGLRAPADA